MTGANQSDSPANLPPDVDALIDQVVRKTRLRKRERVDVARELRSHFEEAIAAGKTSAQALNAFGDPHAAARGLRISARAKRSLLDRTLGQTLRWAVSAAVLLVVLYGGFALYLNTQPRTISFDPIKRFRESLPVPKSPDETVWPAYRDAMISLGVGADDPRRESPGVRAASDDPFSAIDPSSALAQWLTANQAQIDALCAAMKKPILGFPYGMACSQADGLLFGKEAQANINKMAEVDVNDANEFPMLNLLMPHLVTLRHVARIIASDMLLAGAQGDGQRATRDAEAMMALSIHAQEGRFLIGDLVGMRIRELAVNRIIMLLEWKPDVFTDSQLKRLQTAMLSVPQDLERFNAFAERILFADFVQRVYTDDGHGDGWFAPKPGQLELLFWGNTNPPWILEPWGPINAVAVAGRKETLAMYDESMKRLEDFPGLSLRDTVDKGGQADASIQEMLAKNVTRHFLLQSLLPAVGNAIVNYRVDHALREAAYTAIAAELYHRIHGAWPTTASDLAELCGGVSPVDPWNGNPIMIASDGDGFRMWSVGRDGVDHRGDLAIASSPPDKEVRSTVANFRDWDNDSDNPTDQDWVWFAPRGNFDRWKSKK